MHGIAIKLFAALLWLSSAVNAATIVFPSQGGTGVSNSNSATITRSGAHALTITTTGTTNAILPVGTPTLLSSGGALGTPSSGVGTNLTGTAAGFTAGTVTTNANLTGPITSTGNATAVASQTGTGTTFVMSASPTLTGTPNIAAATGTSLATTGAISSTTSGATDSFASIGATTNRRVVRLSNTSGEAILCVEDSAGGNCTAGSTAYDAVLRGQTGISFTANAGSGTQMRLATTSLTVTPTVTFSGLTTAAGTPNSICQNNATKEITVNAALTCTVSSRDYKSGIELFYGQGLKIVNAMRPTTFAYNDRLERRRIGFIAEELAEVDPRLAEWTAEGKANSIDFPAIMGVLTAAIQEQQAQIARLMEQVQMQQTMLDALPQFRIVPVSGSVH